jgi:hypothetical protein
MSGWFLLRRRLGRSPKTLSAGARHTTQHLQEPWAERVPIMIVDGGLAREAAERLAWAGLQAPGAAP